MTASAPSPETDATQQFEHDLQQLLLSAFARGVQLENTWEVTTTVTDAPNWRVCIEKTYSDADPVYEPRFLEE